MAALCFATVAVMLCIVGYLGYVAWDYITDRIDDRRNGY